MTSGDSITWMSAVEVRVRLPSMDSSGLVWLLTALPPAVAPELDDSSMIVPRDSYLAGTDSYTAADSPSEMTSAGSATYQRRKSTISDLAKSTSPPGPSPRKVHR